MKFNRLTGIWRFGLASALLCALLLGTLNAPLDAQSPNPILEGANWMNTPGVSPDQVNEVAREIWCPLCSGVRLDSCELLACHQMKDVIALKLAEGENTAAIKDYFLAQYGPQILGEPPREGFNWLAWILPFVAVAGGAVFLWRQTQRLVRAPEAGQDSVAAQNLPMQQDAQAAQANQPAGERHSPAQPQSEAERRLEEELARYG